MFRKPFSINQTHKVSGADRKKIRRWGQGPSLACVGGRACLCVRCECVKVDWEVHNLLATCLAGGMHRIQASAAHCNWKYLKHSPLFIPNPFALPSHQHTLLLSSYIKTNRAVEKALRLDAQAATTDSTTNPLDALLPPKAGDLELAKLPAPSRLVIYVLDGVPVLLDTSGKSEFVPTVMGLWRCPELLPVVVLKGWQVSPYIVGGRCGVGGWVRTSRGLGIY